MKAFMLIFLFFLLTHNFSSYSAQQAHPEKKIDKNMISAVHDQCVELGISAWKDLGKHDAQESLNTPLNRFYISAIIMGIARSKVESSAKDIRLCENSPDPKYALVKESISLQHKIDQEVLKRASADAHQERKKFTRSLTILYSDLEDLKNSFPKKH